MIYDIILLYIQNIGDDNVYYYQRIKDVREDSDMKQSELAKELGLSQPSYSRYERGEIEFPFHLIIEIAKYYNVSIDYLAGLTTHSKPLYRKGD